MHGSDKIQAEGIASDHHTGQVDSDYEMVPEVLEKARDEAGRKDLRL